MKKVNCLLLAKDKGKDAYLESYLASNPAFRVSSVVNNLPAAIETFQNNPIDLLICDEAWLSQVTEASQNSTLRWPLVVCLPARHLPDLMNLPTHPFLSGDHSSHPPSISRLTRTSQPYESPNRKFIFIKSDYKIIKINLEEILYCEGMKDYTQIYITGKNQPLITLQNLKTFSDKLPKEDFIRVHRSFVISLGKIETISRNEIAVGTKMIPIGHSYRDHLFHLIDKFS
ncbi:MAG TPA: LytTR family DNA-binding domain-containing protein [Chitinophagaceae bacterium]|nr:LytTR family DNA-binding domain-containing protein [Chitinophagaceae bacterium]